MSTDAHHAAIDLGAGSGRVLVGCVTGDRFRLEEVHRFHYAPRRVAGHLRWDAARIIDGILIGIRNASDAAVSQGGCLVSVGVDSWAVDYGLVDAEGRLLEDPICYRDERTERVMAEVFAVVPRAELFARTGIQIQPFNTLFQLVSHTRAGLPRAAARLLLIPDLCHHMLCGSTSCEFTNASTTQLVGAHTGTWDDGLLARLGLPRGLLPEIVPAGTALGRLRPELGGGLGIGALRVIAPATHDTGSAVAAVPLEPGWAYISSGTWSLVGVERDHPLLSEEVARANFTNEGGVFGTVRFLRNVMGLWLLDRCREEWASARDGSAPAGVAPGLPALVDAVCGCDGFPGFVYPDATRFFNPPSMVRELNATLAATGQRVPDDPVRLAKVILDSLALRYASVVGTIERLTGDPVPGVHIVGGGSQNDYLNQATANATGRPVLAGPVEATAAGNLLVQAIASGGLASLPAGRGLLSRVQPPRRFLPRDGAAWAEAAQRYQEIEAAGIDIGLTS